MLRLFLDANVLFVAGYSPTSPVHDLLAFGRQFRTRLAGVEVLVLRDAFRRVLRVPLD